MTTDTLRNVEDGMCRWTTLELRGNKFGNANLEETDSEIAKQELWSRELRTLQ